MYAATTKHTSGNCKLWNTTYKTEKLPAKMASQLRN